LALEMTAKPWMPLYVADYLADTAHLDAAESGAYLHLIMHYWQNGGLPTEDRHLARIARMSTGEWKRAKPVIAPFFSPEWKHKRIDAEIAHADDVSSKRSASAKQRYSNRPANADANAEQKDTQSQSHSPKERKDAAPNGAQPSSDEADLFTRGKKILGKNAGGLITDLLKAKNKNIALARSALEMAATKQDPREYIGAIIRGRDSPDDARARGDAW
jgi:uncharacterized protein YdaU (DUF1376 family)